MGPGHMRGGMGMGMGFGVRRGEFRFLILMALREKPMHGYALIQDIGRTYQRPVSAGVVYPTLQELQDMGLVIPAEKESKKVYSITDEGRKYLEDNSDTVERLKAGKEYAESLGRFNFLRDLRDMHAMVMMNAEYVNNEKLKRIEETLSDAKKKVAAIVFE